MLFPIKDSDFPRVRFTSPYGYRTHPISGKRGSFHRGIDISTMGRNGVVDVIAPEDGVIIYNRTNSGGPSQGYGHYFCIKHSNNVYTFYAHLYARSPIREGQRVKKGQSIAKIGTTGSSTGPHLHFEIHIGKHNFPSQTDVGSKTDPTVDPVRYQYPSLAGYRGKSNLRGFQPSGGFSKPLWVGQVVSDTLNVRNQPTTSGSKVDSLDKGDYVTVYDEEGTKPYTWLEIGEGKFVSNARGDYVTPVSKVLWEATVTASALNIRSNPSTDHTPVGALSRGSKVRVLAVLGKWVYIGKGKFVHADHITKEGEDEMLENAVLINDFLDFPAAQPIMRYKNAPLYERGQEDVIKAKTVYVIGGSKPKIPGAEKIVHLSGKTRFDTAAEVAKHFNW